MWLAFLAVLLSEWKSAQRFPDFYNSFSGGIGRSITAWVRQLTLRPYYAGLAVVWGLSVAPGDVGILEDGICVKYIIWESLRHFFVSE